MISPEQVRANLDRLIRERGVSARALSLAIRRNQAYVQQFITRGTPVKLEEEDRRVIASMLGVSEEELGAPAGATRDRELVQIRRLPVEASAGPGAVVEGEEPLGEFGFGRAWLRRLTPSRPEQLSLIRVKGDSMTPTLLDGDDVLVDHAQADPKRRDGVYVLRRDDALMIKRLSMAPASPTLTISSDNPAHPTWRDCPLDGVAVVGRVVWIGRRQP